MYYSGVGEIKISPCFLHVEHSLGVLASHPASRDVHIDRLSITSHGTDLLSDAKLELNCGRRCVLHC